MTACSGLAESHGPLSADRRRYLKQLATSSLTLGLSACERQSTAANANYSGRWLEDNHQLGHQLRADQWAAAPPSSRLRRVAVLIVGGGVAGLAAARALIAKGVDDFAVLELSSTAGGNSRAHQLDGQTCPLGAHYLPTPSAFSYEVKEWLHSIGVARQEHGHTVYDERFLCHSPQERLFIQGRWQEGLLPPTQQATTQTAYRRFAQVVQAVQQNPATPFTIPTTRAQWSPALTALDQESFATWLRRQELTDPALIWYLDYCCRDDYGAGLQQVSAWAGLHYFASRHGFHAPHEVEASGYSRDQVLTWPQGNAFLTDHLITPLGTRLQVGHMVYRISPQRHEVAVRSYHAATQQHETWLAQYVIVALPLFIARRIIDQPPIALQTITPQLRYAPWLVSNLVLREPLLERFGPPLAWDNVLYQSPALGYVNARHQDLALPALKPVSVLTHYWALGGQNLHQLQQQRQHLLTSPWQHWAARIVADLQAAHPDIGHKLAHIDLMRYGHAMSIPHPGLRSHPALQALAEPLDRLCFVHSDLSSYSVFEEAFTRGTLAAQQLYSSR